MRTSTKRRMFRNIERGQSRMESVQSYLGLISHGNTMKLQQEAAEALERPIV
ncbi:MAG: hypothetical protein ABII13_05760 [Patescibacteria group bacterium]